MIRGYKEIEKGKVCGYCMAIDNHICKKLYLSILAEELGILSDWHNRPCFNSYDDALAFMELVEFPTSIEWKNDNFGMVRVIPRKEI